MSHKISKNLIKNYLQIKRDLPWRDTNDPYKIWLSEVILQQTRVNQGLPYYISFVEKYPDVKSLALSSEDDVLKLWQGLGYYSRARNMRKTAQAVFEKYGNVFPSSYNDLLSLKGIGPYTASAVASFAGNEAYAVVDGNVNRVITRLFGIKELVDTAIGKKVVSEAAQSILDEKNPGLHNQAIMEHGALVCTPKNPDCLNCVLADVCVAFAEKKMTEYPFKKEKKAVKKRFMVFGMIDDGKKIMIQKRGEDDIWAGLYQFPIMETEMVPNDENIDFFANQWSIKPSQIKNYKVFPVIKHILTHRHLILYFVHFTVKPITQIDNSLIISIQELKKYPFPVVIVKFLNTHYEDFFEGKV